MGGKDFETVPCNLCGEDSPIPLFKINQFQIVKCSRCDLVYTNPRLRREDLQRVYDRSYFHSHNSLVHGYEDYQQDKPSIQRTFQHRWNFIKQFISVQQGDLLDIGCALGYFLEIAKTEGWRCKGLDTSEYAVCYARESLGLDVERASLLDLPYSNNSFDAIVLWDVIEHLPDPTHILHLCFKKLRPGGILSVITPDQNSMAARMLGKRWVEYQKPHEHIYFFSRSNFTQILTRIGFSVEWAGTAAKYVTLSFALKRLQAYQHFIFSVLTYFAKFLRIEGAMLNINPRDKMFIIAKRPDGNVM